MKNLVFSSLLLFLLSGCSASLLNSYERLPETGIQGSGLLPWFQGNDNPILYKTSIGIYKNYYSGLMLIKPVSDTSHRLVLLTEPGIKILDMEFFRSGDFRLHYCLEAMNRRYVIRTLQNDFGLMIHNIPAQDKKVKIFEDAKAGRTVTKQKSGLGATYYFRESGTNSIDSIVQTKGTGKKVTLRFYSAAENVMDSVRISHYKIKLDIHLTALHENKPALSE